MKYLTISKPQFHDFVHGLIGGEREVNGVVKKGTGYVYDRIDDIDDLCLDYDETILPPKKFFLPVKEVLLTFKPRDPASYHEEIPSVPRVILGIHPWDLAAIALLDKTFSTGTSDANYLANRRNSLLVGIYPTQPWEYRFSNSMISDEHFLSADLMLVDMEDENYVVEVVTEKGSRWIRKSLAAPADEKTVIESEQKKNRWQDKVTLSLSREDLPEFLEKRQTSRIFDRLGEKCFSCGSCVLVCPTCYCFHVEEEVDLSLKAGRRVRSWDGCMIEGFALAAGGHNFRETPANRLRHRILRKGKYLPEHFDMTGCVGCGRCAHACVAGIASPVEVINQINHSIYLPEVATILKTEPMTDTDRFFEFELEGRSLGHQPGQFVELSIPGIGEAPFSVSSSPTRKGGFEMLIRNVGRVTAFIHHLRPGDKVGVRGPFGTHFALERFKGKDLLFIAGGLGLAPLRSAINYVLDNRVDYGQMAILSGARDPSHRLFPEETKNWGQVPHTFFLETVDQEDEEWSGNTGVITTLLPEVQDKLRPENTKVFIVGPPVMYKFVLLELSKMGFDDADIMVSLERRMECGVGKCGHCQIDDIYVCQEGPVFNYGAIKDLMEAL
jgi:sulfite reductase subunit B